MLKIIKQPEDCKILENDYATFSVLTNQYKDVQYKWFYKAPNSKTWKDATLSGQFTNTYIVKGYSRRNCQQYRCAITYEGKTIYSDIGILHIVEDIPDKDPTKINLPEDYPDSPPPEDIPDTLPGV